MADIVKKTIQTRIAQKHDVEENWNKAENFIPKKGEIIIYDKDDNHVTIRVKVGDGVTVVKSLPFITDNYYTKSETDTKLNGKQAQLNTTQLAAVNSGITSDKVNKYDNYQSQITSKYAKPTTGIPKTDLASAVQTSLGKADTAVQSVTTGSANGTISVDGSNVSVKGLGTAAYKADTYFATQTAYSATAAQVNTNTQDIADLKETVTGGMHFKGKFDSLPAVTSYSAGDFVIVGTKEYILYVDASSNKSWVELGDEGSHLTKVQADEYYVAKNSNITAGTHTKITYDSKGLVTGGTELVDSDIPNIPASKITSGTFADARIASASVWNAKQNALTADQLAAANSGITAEKVATYNGYATTLAGKQDKLTETQLNAVNSGITSTKVTTYDGYQAKIDAKYTKPTGGIPKTDLSSAVQTSLGKADSALQSHQQITTGSANGTISVDGSDVAVKGLKALAYKDSLTKTDVGLGNVNNTSDAEKPISTATQAALNKKQDSLTTTQLNAVNSGITSGKVSTYDGYQAKIDAKYTKPTDGIPKDDLASSVQTSLGKADKALQTHQTITTGSANGTIAVGGSDVAVKGLGSLAYKNSLTKSDVGLGNVENKSSTTIRSEITKSNVTSALGYTPLNSSLKGANSGIAELDENGKIPSSQLPSYVDDCVEGYLYNNKLYKESSHTTEISGESGKIYIDLASNKTYRWSGSAFVEISASLALGETSSTAYRGDRGKIAYDHSQAAHAPSNAEKNIIVGVQRNGTDLTVDSNRKVNITVPTKTSELSNDSGFTTSSDIPKASTTSPKAAGTAAVGTESAYARGDHVHPSDSTKVDKVSGKGLSTNDYTTAEKNKLSGIATGANKTIVDSALSSSSTNPVQNNVVTNALNYRINYGDALLTTNPFGGKHLYISKIDNAFYAADKRWTVSGKLYDAKTDEYKGDITNIQELFNGNYEGSVNIPIGQYALITIDFSTEYAGQFPGYPYGDILISFYYNSIPASLTARAYCNFEAHGIGWHDLTGSYFNGSASSTADVIYKFRNNSYAISTFEFKIYSKSDITCNPVQIEMNLDRPDPSKTPLLSKYRPETLYYPLTCPEFKGNLTGNATKDGNGNTITSTYIKGLSASGQTVTYTKGDGSTGTITTQDTTYSAGTHISIDGTTINASWPTASDSGYAGINKTGTVTGVKVNGTTKSPVDGVVDIGPVPTVVQTTGTSTANVMSQNSVTNELGKKADLLVNESTVTTVQSGRLYEFTDIHNPFSLSINMDTFKTSNDVSQIYFTAADNFDVVLNVSSGVRIIGDGVNASAKKISCVKGNSYYFTFGYTKKGVSIVSNIDVNWSEIATV